jgi:hypothetical protein
VPKSLKKIFDKIFNRDNINNLVVKQTDFTRHNKLTFEAVVFKILHSFQDSVDFNLCTFLPQLNIPAITAGAFSIARYKLKIELFLGLNRELNQLIENLPTKLWKGFRLIAGDGTTVNLPVSESTINHFGLFRDSKNGGKTVMANACMLYDLLTDYVLSADIAPFCEGEKTIMKRLLNETKFSNSIALFDRGFSAFYFIKHLINNDLNFCIRLNSRISNFGKDAMRNPSNDFITQWSPSEAEQHTCRKMGVDVAPLDVRITKVTLPSGEVDVLVSNLTDMKRFSLDDLAELYQLRWAVEEGYKKLKPKMKLEQFGCKKYEGIYQEFFAHIFMMNLTTLIGNQAQEAIELSTRKRKFGYKYNWVNAYKFLKHSFVELIQADDIEMVIMKIITSIKKSIVAIVPNRKFVRQTQSIKKHRFSPMYK